MFKDWNFDDFMNHAMMAVTVLALLYKWFLT